MNEKNRADLLIELANTQAKYMDAWDCYERSVCCGDGDAQEEYATKINTLRHKLNYLKREIEESVK